ncbi:fungal-specific transcription factor domain-containing protein [Jackrogersella minutella]|nr:fungal-specific transcription factor domain-containing protein [Jackrogersella minutella]
MSDDGPSNEASAGQTADLSLSCVSCRTRKLKCDRTKPICNRCEKAKLECVFPESRRKPTFKRRNVKELEARLAQVEVLLKEAGQNRSLHNGKTAEPVNIQPTPVPVDEEAVFQGMDFTTPDLSFDDGGEFSFEPDPTAAFSSGNLDDHGQSSAPFDGALIDLGGIYESLPPFKVMEDLNQIFFDHQQHLIPIIHPLRYLQAFYSPPHMKPPMCLQYAIWALAAHGDPKYGMYHDIFYRRARQYTDTDEMKGHGEHFITVAHAQAFCVIATYEAKSMMFTRAAMTCAKAVRLATMMGLHRLDGAAEEMSPTLLPPKTWAETEERRRVFWGVFCIDSHCSISTGWPFLIDASEVTTLLPAPEPAFHNGDKVETYNLHDAFKGLPYSSFAGAVLVCHLFNQILKHVHKPKPNDNPDNYEYGEYWQRHREIDNTLSSAFMCLPQSFRLPENYRDLIAVHTNLNLHASIICLHHSAIERIDTYKLPDSAKKTSQDRLSTAAQEIVNIIKLTSHVNSSPKSPLAALSLYCAASVYIYLCKESQAPMNPENLDFIISAMEALGRDHTITRAFLRQVLVDIERNDLRHLVRLSRLDSIVGDTRTQMSHNIPLLARSSISRHTQVQPPLPGRLPLGNPVGKIIDGDRYPCEYGTWTSEIRDVAPPPPPPLGDTPPPLAVEPAGGSKRRRVSPTGARTTNGGPAPDYGAAVPPPQPRAELPHRGVGLNILPSMLRSFAPAPYRARAKDGVGDWGLAGDAQFHVHHDDDAALGESSSSVPWSMAGSEGVNIDWAAIGASLGLDPGIAADVAGGEECAEDAR